MTTYKSRDGRTSVDAVRIVEVERATPGQWILTLGDLRDTKVGPVMVIEPKVGDYWIFQSNNRYGGFHLHRADFDVHYKRPYARRLASYPSDTVLDSIKNPVT